MRMTPLQFITKFDAEFDKDRQNAAFNELVLRSTATPGVDVAITMLARTGTIELTARADLRDHRALQMLIRALAAKTVEFRPGCWIEGRAAQAGMLCHVEGEIAALMSASDVVHVTIELQEFDLVIDGSNC